MLAHLAVSSAHLLFRTADGNVLAMYTLARMLQFAGLVIPPLAIMAQLAESISLGQMLGFLVVAISLFSIGHMLQQHSGRDR